MLGGKKIQGALSVIIAVCIMISAAGCRHSYPDIIDEVTQAIRLRCIAPTPFAGRFSGGFMIEDGIAYIGSQSTRDLFVTEGTSNYLHAYDISDGRKLWDRSLSGGPGEGFHGGIFYDRALMCGPGGSTLFAFENRDGQCRWSYRINPDHSGNIADIVTDGDRIFAGTRGGRLVALQLPRGEAAWKRNLGRYSSGPFLTGTGVIIRGINRMVCYSRRSGRRQWQVLVTPYWPMPKVKYSEGRVCFISGGSPPKLQCINASDGTPVWSVDVNEGFALLPDDFENIFVFQDGFARQIHTPDKKVSWSQKLLRDEADAPGAHDFRGITDYGDVLVVEMRDRSRGQTELSVLEKKRGKRLQYVVLYQNAPWLIVDNRIVSLFQDNIRAWSLREPSRLWSKDFKDETILAETIIHYNEELFFLARGGTDAPSSKITMYGIDSNTGEIRHRFVTGFSPNDIVRLFVDADEMYFWNLTAKLIFKLEYRQEAFQ